MPVDFYVVLRVSADCGNLSHPLASAGRRDSGVSPGDCEAAGGHTEGSMNVIVKTAEGVATICGDVLYDINDQLVEPFREISDMEPRVTGNHGTTKRQEKAAIKKVVASSRFVLPVHDRPALIEAGQVVGRLQDAVPGPVVQSLPRRNWFPA